MTDIQGGYLCNWKQFMEKMDESNMRTMMDGAMDGKLPFGDPCFAKPTSGNARAFSTR